MLSDSVISKSELKCDISVEYELSMIKHLSELSSSLFRKIEQLEDCNNELKKIENLSDRAKRSNTEVLALMDETRKIIDEIEKNMPKKYWPYPTYEDIIYSV